MITGLDLVELQIKIAEGLPLSIKQEDVALNGHSIELRVYAENPNDGFIPSTGKLKAYKPPVGEGIRVDEGYAKDMEIPVHYDPMISKLIVHSSDRNEAIQRLTYAINHYQVRGVETTLGYGKFAINHPDFRSGNFDTHFVEKNKREFMLDQGILDESASAFVAWLYKENKKKLTLPKMD
jgi:propionyl-CoA carboxylase alpha chain